MKPATAALIALCLMVCGCSPTPQPTETATNVLGPSATYVLANPTRVEGWNFRRPDGTIANDPRLQPLDPEIGRDLAKVLLDPDTYAQPARGGAFERAVGFRVWRADQNVEAYLSFRNDQMYLTYTGYTGQPTSTLIGVTAARDALLRVTRKAFPGYEAPAAK